MIATTTAIKYRPAARISGRDLDTIARKLARYIRTGYSVRKLVDAAGKATYILTDERGEDIDDTVFTVTAA